MREASSYLLPGSTRKEQRLLRKNRGGLPRLSCGATKNIEARAGIMLPWRRQRQMKAAVNRPYIKMELYKYQA